VVVVFAMLHWTMFPAIAVYVRNSVKRGTIGTKDKREYCSLPRSGDRGYFGNNTLNDFGSQKVLNKGQNLCKPLYIIGVDPSRPRRLGPHQNLRWWGPSISWASPLSVVASILYSLSSVWYAAELGQQAAAAISSLTSIKASYRIRTPAGW